MNDINYAQELNELFGSTLEEIEKDLNKWSFGSPTPEKTPLGYTIPTLVSLGNATVRSRNEDSFNLESPWAGMVKDIQVETLGELGDTIVIRRIYGYAGVMRALESKDPKAILPMVKEMVNKLIQVRGFTPDKLNMGIYGTFKRPGVGNEYFRDCENYAGLELRLYSSTTLAEKL